MNILRNFARWACFVGISTALSIWIMVATAEATILNRNVTEGWLRQSGVYSKNLNDFLQVTPGASGNTIITNTVLQQAFARTFTPSYIQNSTETALNATYDWLEGKTPAIHFSIPVQDKSDEFARNLAEAATPFVQELPTCSSKVAPSDNSCVPVGMTAADYAAQITRLAKDGTFLNAPLTEQSFMQQNGLQSTNTNWLPQAVQAAHTLYWALPIVIVVLGGAAVLLSADRLRGAAAVGRQLTINTVITLIGGILLWYFGGTIDLRNSVDTSNAQSAAVANSYVTPLVRVIMPSVGQALALYSGIVVASGAALWISMSVIAKRQTARVGKQVSHPDIPAPTQDETRLPPPTNAPTPPAASA